MERLMRRRKAIITPRNQVFVNDFLSLWTYKLYFSIKELYSLVLSLGTLLLAGRELV